MNNNGPILGVTLFSLTNEWQQNLYTLDGLIAKVAELGLGPGIEVVGFQSFRSYPDVPDAEADHFQNLLAKHGLIPTCLGANIDIGRRRDRLMNADEIYETVRRQLISAKKLGFPIMRVPPSAGGLTLENLLALAEEYQIQLAVELHSPLSVDNPEVVKLRSMYERLKSPFLGFIPDFSTSMTSVPEGHWNNVRRAGASEELIDAAKEIWLMDDPIPTKFGALGEACQRFGASPAVIGQINMTMTMFGHMPVENWREILPYVSHVHGKYYEVTSEGIEPSIPYRDLMHLLKREGYQGTISAEWEGQAFTEEPLGFEQVSAWNAMCKKFLEE
jgi:sugar phosphate isomerase/epimerase